MPDRGDYLSEHDHQATCMIAAQVDSCLCETLNRLRIRAAAMDQSLEHTALNVLAA